MSSGEDRQTRSLKETEFGLELASSPLDRSRSRVHTNPHPFCSSFNAEVDGIPTDSKQDETPMSRKRVERESSEPKRKRHASGTMVEGEKKKLKRAEIGGLSESSPDSPRPSSTRPLVQPPHPAPRKGGHRELLDAEGFDTEREIELVSKYLSDEVKKGIKTTPAALIFVKALQKLCKDYQGGSESQHFHGGRSLEERNGQEADNLSLFPKEPGQGKTTKLATRKDFAERNEQLWDSYVERMKGVKVQFSAALPCYFCAELLSSTPTPLVFRGVRDKSNFNTHADRHCEDARFKWKWCHYVADRSTRLTQHVLNVHPIRACTQLGNENIEK